MLLKPSADQEFFQETTSKFLSQEVPVDVVRGLRDDPSGFGRDYWRKGAALGWTSLLVSESAGGGSLSGDGLIDLSLVAHEFGMHAAPGPLAAVNVAAYVLSESGRGPEELASILSGESIAIWCSDPTQLASEVRGGEVVLNGTSRAAESAGVADRLIVTGEGTRGMTQVVVPADSPGLSVAPMRSVDLTRRFWRVHFDEVRLPVGSVLGSAGGAQSQWERQLRLAASIAAAEMVGAMQAAFDMTVEWAFDRYTFGRPLASYQELKHRFADMKMWLEASHAISDAAVAAVQADSPDADELVSAAKSYVGDRGSELIQDCVQLHGGIGLTFEHDLHLFLRRHTLDRSLYGTPREHRRRVGALVEAANGGLGQAGA